MLGAGLAVVTAFAAAAVIYNQRRADALSVLAQAKDLFNRPHLRFHGEAGAVRIVEFF
jgi:hypothetical protein